MADVSLAEWNRFLLTYPNAHLLQTGEWGELKSAFGWRAIRVINGDFGAQILFRKLPLGSTIGYMPKPVFGDQSSEVSHRFWQEVDTVCRSQHAIFLKLEPDCWGRSPEYGWPKSDWWTLSRYNIQPASTIIVDVSDSEEAILSHMKQKTRYNIRLAGKKGVAVRAWDDMAAFHQLMLVTGGRDGFGVHSLDYYRRAYDLFHSPGLCELLVAEYDDKPLAALMVFAHGRRAWYIYGASNDVERNRMPMYLLQWEAMRWAKSHGCSEYDLWGVPDAEELTLEAEFETRNDGLWGVYRFKRGFGGELKRASQSLDRIYRPWLYRFYLWWSAGREAG